MKHTCQARLTSTLELYSARTESHMSSKIECKSRCLAMFKVGPQAKILTNNPLLARWTLDGPYGKVQKAAGLSQKSKNYLPDVCWTWEESSKATAYNVGPQIKSLKDDTGQKCYLRFTG